MNESWLDLSLKLGIIAIGLVFFARLITTTTPWRQSKARAIGGMLVLLVFIASIGGLAFAPQRNCSESLYGDGNVDRPRVAEIDCKQENSNSRAEWTKAIFILFAVAGIYGISSGIKPMFFDEAWTIVNKTADELANNPSLRISGSKFEEAVKTLEALPLTDDYMSRLRALEIVLRANRS